LAQVRFGSIRKRFVQIRRDGRGGRGRCDRFRDHSVDRGHCPRGRERIVDQRSGGGFWRGDVESGF
jgi:hypothetical protein